MLEEERKTKMKKTNGPTHETGTKFILNNKENKPHSSISLLCYKTKISIMIIINSTFSPLSNNNNHTHYLNLSVPPPQQPPTNPPSS